MKNEPLYTGPIMEDSPHVALPCLRCGKAFKPHDSINVHYLTPRATVTTHTDCVFDPKRPDTIDIVLD